MVIDKPHPILAALAAGVFCTGLAFAIQLPQVEQTQVQFLTADSAEILDDEDRVKILVSNLDNEVGYGVIIVPEGTVNWIEAWKNGEFPPQVVKEMDSRPGSYLVTGSPGDVFQLRIDRHPEFPTYEQVRIGQEKQIKRGCFNNQRGN